MNIFRVILIACIFSQTLSAEKSQTNTNDISKEILTLNKQIEELKTKLQTEENKNNHIIEENKNLGKQLKESQADFASAASKVLEIPRLEGDIQIGKSLQKRLEADIESLNEMLTTALQDQSDATKQLKTQRNKVRPWL